MREVVVTVKDGETEETAQGLVGQVRVRWGPEDLPKAKSLDLICAQKDYSGCRARTDQRGQGWGRETSRKTVSFVWERSLPESQP